jgi:hypothetical protein
MDGNRTGEAQTAINGTAVLTVFPREADEA